VIHRQSFEVLAAVGAPVAERSLDCAPLLLRQVSDRCGHLPRSAALLGEIGDLGIRLDVLGLLAVHLGAMTVSIGTGCGAFHHGTVLSRDPVAVRLGRVGSGPLSIGARSRTGGFAPRELARCSAEGRPAVRAGLLGPRRPRLQLARVGDRLTGLRAGWCLTVRDLPGDDPEVGTADRAGAHLATGVAQGSEANGAGLRACAAEPSGNQRCDGLVGLAADVAWALDAPSVGV